ncbi:MAG: 4Fe-4S binding protein [Longimicrobiales bacterium]
MCRKLGPALLVAVGLAFFANPTAAQDIAEVRAALLAEVMPGADRFERAEGDPPVRRAFSGDSLVGYVFITSDFPPEVDGYSGPVRALVGMTPEGLLTGVRVTDYRESRRYDWGDFLSDPWLLDQFTGKHVAERFRVNQDIDGISQVTISVRALARGVRDAARRVALAYAVREPGASSLLSDAELEAMTWYEMRQREVAVTMSVVQEGRAPFSVSLLHVPSDSFGVHMVGRMYQSILAAVERRGGAPIVVLYAVDGTGFQAPLKDGWSIEQGGKATPVPAEDVVTVGVPGGGLLLEESSQAGALLLDADRVDITAPLTFVFDRGRPDLGAFRVAYTSQSSLAREAELAASAPAAASSSAPEAPPAPTPMPTVETAPIAEAPAVVAPASPPSDQLVQFDFTDLAAADEQDAGLLASASWSRVGWTLLVLTLAMLAFLTKNAALRWVSLSTTLVVLGWLDGGFLSISHVTGLIWVGPSAITSDLPLLIMVAFTALALLLWGRVFCGYLCPFGALQDVIDRLVPARLKRELPRGAHRLALKSKYFILAIILLPAIAGSQASLYQYFEPFGTVFFIGRDPLLWGIAGTLLVAAAIVPRFYCRYACPLGASLALGSLVALRRIPRVEQCDHCKVCQQHCPTGAIEGPALDFKECVRCNDCEIRLVEKSGVCKHDMEAIRPRLVQIRARIPAGVAGSQC